MKTNKKFYAFMLSLAMMLSAISPAFAAVVNYGDELTNMPNKNYTQKFSDVPASYWAFNYIAEMAERNVLSGYPNGKFYPNKNVTRAEFAKIMTAAAGLKISIGYSSYEDVNYTDWCSPYIEAARYYLSGYVSNGKSYYMPNNNALREDIAVALVKLKGYDTTGFDLSLLQTMFSDWKSISTGAQPYVAVAVEQELISGYDDGTFKGQQGITRAEAATLLWRAYQYGNDNKDFEQEVIETPKPTKEPEPTATPNPVKETPKPTKKPEITPEPEETEKPEPTPDYEWKIDTVATNVGFVEEYILGDFPGNGYYIYKLTAGKNTVIYSDDTSLYEAGDNSNSKIFSCDELEWQGEPMSKKDTLSQSISTYGYNYCDDCIYAIIHQYYGSEHKYVVYNITDQKIVCLTEGQGKIIGFYSDGRIETTNGTILPDGSVVDDYRDTYWNKYLIYNDNLYKYERRGFEIGICYYLGKFNLSTNSYDGIDTDTDEYFETVSCATGCFYKDNSNGIKKLDLNGDSHELLQFTQIRVDDSIPVAVNHLNGLCVDSDESIYFYDKDYKSIRKIERIK